MKHKSLSSRLEPPHVMILVMLSKRRPSCKQDPRWSNGHDFRLSIPAGNKRGRPGFDSQSGRSFFCLFVCLLAAGGLTLGICVMSVIHIAMCLSWSEWLVRGVIPPSNCFLQWAQMSRPRCMPW
ncbi:uncharacterized protein BO72DRAFT_220565 [Aspergillus fijiensis CBS 313.89]|uniref:Transmembrane protein n=1 Tax=Aspergillus fijiensis CBS 313.89 TaxID=1448319 RepID=A0A8G1RJC1_9EURO|nr:uncharacterized protein BO72DRAFT_220565 [Aspergillus fijiensis CBS 313.89]RAK73859.1 hypothetical protein BO72DRAFT_220565 [Aspergillus fijiensis CBS 313.89]